MREGGLRFQAKTSFPHAKTANRQKPQFLAVLQRKPATAALNVCLRQQKTARLSSSAADVSERSERIRHLRRREIQQSICNALAARRVILPAATCCRINPPKAELGPSPLGRGREYLHSQSSNALTARCVLLPPATRIRKD